MTASEEKSDDPSTEPFSNAVMSMSYLYSKLPETGVPRHIGTGGPRSVIEIMHRATKELIASGAAPGDEY